MEERRRFTWLCLWLLTAGLGLTDAQTISATSTVRAAGANNGSSSPALELAVARDSRGEASGRFSVVSLSDAADPSFPTLSGPLILANASSQLAIADSNIVLINCDPYTGNIQPSDVFDLAESRNATGIVLYSTERAGCISIDVDTETYSRIFTLTNGNDAKEMLEVTMALGHAAYGLVGRRDELGNNTGTPTDSAASSQTSQAQQQNAFGPSPSTAVAMIILYSITGIITALFLVIIITGAVRAHRHPERYGPRTGVGRPRQSRARGLARAMLETIPIVKFGDREAEERVQQQQKPTEVELEEGHGTRQTDSPAQENETQQRGVTEPSTEQNTTTVDTNTTSTTTASGGIAAAAADSSQPEKDDTPSCGICTEDFQTGEDQRVLPCNHRFHPACVDPWLLNVSGTCPLCRIDLRPDEETTENENGEASENLPPPLAGGRMGVRRSLMIGLLGARPERMTREERVSALRAYRDSQRSQQQQQEEEPGLRQRLRNKLRIRTRRTGGEEHQQQQDGNQDGNGNGNAGSSSS